MTTGIGVLREGPLHAAVKTALAQPGDRFEVPVDRYVIDLVRAGGELVEVQTGGFGPLGPKLDALLDDHAVRIVYPVAAERRILRVDEHGEVLAARRSPKRGSALELFERLVTFPSVVTHPNLTIEVLLLREDHIRRPEKTPNRRGRLKDPGERRFVDVLERIELRTVTDYVGLLPPLPAEPFGTADINRITRAGTRLSQRILYCLKAMGAITVAGARGRAPLYELCPVEPRRTA